MLQSRVALVKGYIKGKKCTLTMDTGAEKTPVKKRFIPSSCPHTLFPCVAQQESVPLSVVL